MISAAHAEQSSMSVRTDTRYVPTNQTQRVEAAISTAVVTEPVATAMLVPMVKTQTNPASASWACNEYVDLRRLRFILPLRLVHQGWLSGESIRLLSQCQKPKTQKKTCCPSMARKRKDSRRAAK